MKWIVIKCGVCNIKIYFNSLWLVLVVKRLCECQSLSLSTPGWHLCPQSFWAYNTNTWVFGSWALSAKCRLQLVFCQMPGNRADSVYRGLDPLCFSPPSGMVSYMTDLPCTRSLVLYSRSHWWIFFFFFQLRKFC